MLRDVPTAILTTLRSYDVAVRWGGDEFVCALSDVTVEVAADRFDDIRRAFAALRPEASISVGLAALERRRHPRGPDRAAPTRPSTAPRPPAAARRGRDPPSASWDDERRPLSTLGPVPFAFTPSHRGGEGPPLVCLHGFTDTWRTWELVLPELERHHDVLAPTLLGHAGGPPLEGEVHATVLADAVERAMDDADIGTAHLVGNSLGGFVALQLAARGRARSVVAFAPAGGWAVDDDSFAEMLRGFVTMRDQLAVAAPNADAIVATAQGRRRATALITTNYAHIPAELIAHQMVGAARCDAVAPMVAFALREGYDLDARSIACPVRIVWGTDDALLPWPSAATRYRGEWLPQADWVVLDEVGHCPQLDVPLEAAQLIVGFTAR